MVLSAFSTEENDKAAYSSSKMLQKYVKQKVAEKTAMHIHLRFRKCDNESSLKKSLFYVFEACFHF